LVPVNIPPPLGLPHIGITTQTVDGKPKKGVKGALQWGCLPLWGSEEVTLISN